jgi:hypothetical protein
MVLTKQASGFPPYAADSEMKRYDFDDVLIL